MKGVPRDIVFCALVPWGRMPYWRWRSLFRAVVRDGHRVLWVDHFSSWGQRQMISYLASDLRRLRGQLITGERGIQVLLSPIRIPHQNGHLAETTAARAVKAVKRAVDSMGFDAPLLWTSTPRAEPLIGNIGESGVLYDCPDDLRSIGADAVMLEREARLEARADLVLTCVPSVEAIKRETSRRVACVANGVDAEHFKTAAEPGPVPPRLQRLARPVIGYSGVMYDRIDWELVEAVCKLKPDWTVLFMGLVQEPPPARVASLPNLRVLGEVAFEDLPAHYRAIDICWVPHKVNQLTARQSSLKVLEYLAAGRPVVTTDIPLPSDLTPLVNVGAGATGIVKALTRAAGQDTLADRNERQAAAARHSWDESFRQIQEVMAPIWV